MATQIFVPLIIGHLTRDIIIVVIFVNIQYRGVELSAEYLWMTKKESI